MTEKTMTLGDVKDQVSYEWFLKPWLELSESRKSDICTEVAKRYARECCKASLEWAAGKAEVTSYELPIENGGGTQFVVDKDTITNESNIVIL